MTWNDVLVTAVNGLLSIVIMAVLTYSTVLINKYVKNKKVKDILNDVLNNIVMPCVKEVRQTVVDSLKQADDFTEAKQKEAFQICLNKCLTLMSDESKKIITENFGDLESYLTTLIESAVGDTKITYIPEEV